MNQFVILTYGRSGSTFISRWLNRHYEVVSLGEIIRVAISRYTIVQYFMDQKKYTLAKIFAFIIRNPHIGFFISVVFSKSVKTYFNYIFSEYHIRNPDKKVSHPKYAYKTQGFNLAYRQLFLFWGLKKHITQIKIIHLLRKNILAVYISKLVGIKYNLYHSREKIHAPKVRVPIKNLKWKLNLIKLQQNYFTSMIRSTDHISIYYEDFFSKERNKYESEILSFLNVKIIQISDPKIKKLSSSTIKDRVTNYEEIVKALRGTQFAYCLD